MLIIVRTPPCIGDTEILANGNWELHKNMTSIFFSLQAILSENIEMFKFLAKDSFKVYFYNDPIIQMLVIIIIMFISKTEESLLTYVSYF